MNDGGLYAWLIFYIIFRDFDGAPDLYDQLYAYLGR